MSTQTIKTKAAITTLLSFAALLHVHGAADPRRLSETTDIHDIAKRFELSRPRISGNSALLRSQEHKLIFHANSRKLQFNNAIIWLNAPTMINRKRWIVTDQDAEKTLAPLLRPRSYLPPAETPIVVLDPGHGGADSGAIGSHGLYEKDVTLDVCRRTAMHLRNAGIRTALTRKSDQTLALADRSTIAKRHKATVFVSVHVNSSSNPQSTGYETYIVSAAGFPSTAEGSRPGKRSIGNRFDAASLLLAYSVHTAILPATATPDRGIRHARFAVLRAAPCPAILIETGFISNPREEARLATSGYRESLATAISQGLIHHFKQRTFLPAPYLAEIQSSQAHKSPLNPAPNVPIMKRRTSGTPNAFAVEPTRATKRRK
ncbi:MAG: N-acetylmuramoyl-L-alanine amidase [Kiritimatiellae bacterium]|nr:N-acetylmuramoyl-L-alanine amidase [Kiritimatiellia bacterium]